jgi:hypothetical protein
MPADRTTDDECTVIAQDQRFSTAQVANERLLLFELQDDTAVVMVANLQKAHRSLCHRQ